MSHEAILDNALASEGAYLRALEELVRRESPTNDKGACDALADQLADVLAAGDWGVKRHARADVGDVLEARLEGAGGVSTLLLAHLDTVWPLGTLEEMPLRRDGDKLFGPGTVDMKAGIVTALTAVDLASGSGRTLIGDVTLLITSDEETGSGASRELIEELARRHDRVLVLEPGRDDGALKIGRKGVGDFDVTFVGRSAHAGNNPSGGASAIRELAHFLLYVEDLADEVAGTTVNLTMVNGGFARNVIAERAVASVDLRVLTAAEAQRVEVAVRSYQPRDTRVSFAVEGGLNRPPMERTPANEELLALAQDGAAELGLELEAAVVGGGSDGNFTSALGIATLDGLGSVGGGPHARDEHIRVRETLQRVALLSWLLTES
ncbi:MAG TPA: M20 family metallopeptidase [Trueperaceae bacterium]|nr:M20 family metallopeptidase [Trueperaceae bacterium]